MSPSVSTSSSQVTGSLRTLALAASCFFFASHLASAQEYGRKLLDLDNPDETRTFSPEKSSFHGARGFSGGKDARVKDFYSPARFRSKDYTTGAYSGNKQAWMGDFTYSTKSADTEGRSQTRRMVREHRTKSAAVRESRDANRGYKTAQHSTADRKSDYRGKSQDKIDREGPVAVLSIPGDSGFTKLETIDDIRNLLNKN